MAFQGFPDFGYGNSSWEISLCLLVFPSGAFSVQNGSDIIQHDRFRLLAIWSHQFC